MGRNGAVSKKITVGRGPTDPLSFDYLGDDGSGCGGTAGGFDFFQPLPRAWRSRKTTFQDKT